MAKPIRRINKQSRVVFPHQLRKPELKALAGVRNHSGLPKPGYDNPKGTDTSNTTYLE